MLLKCTHNTRDEERLEGIHSGCPVGVRVPQRNLLLQFVGRLLGALAPPTLRSLLAGLHPRRGRSLARLLEAQQERAHSVVALLLLLVGKLRGRRQVRDRVPSREQREQVRRKELRHPLVALSLT